MARIGPDERSSRLEQIEAALQARWDRETLEVYADALQAAGDPRGSLIALALSGVRDTPALVRQRDQLVAAWLGGFELERPSWLIAHTGFVSLQFYTLPSVTAFLASHLAPFLRRVRLFMPPAECAAALEALASRVHPWCVELEIQFNALHSEAVPIPPAIVEQLAEAMPHLATLRLDGVRVLHAPIPPSIERLVLDPRALIGRLPMPAVTELVLPSLHLRGPGSAIAELLHPQPFPGLRRLDFEQNEGHLGDVLAVIERVEALDRLSWLRLPSLRGEGDVRRVRDLLARAPALVIDMARAHRPLWHLAPRDEPRIRVPAPVPCAPPDAMEGANDRLAVSVPGCDRAFELYIGLLAYNTESYYATFSSEQQAALTALWDRIPALGATPVGFPGAAMARVAETMMLTDCDAQLGIEPWGELEQVLRGLPCAVMIARRH
ncbi:MAG TPA: hypothetical protein VNO30_02310 [Kofleriaceae bacterium]|nr:hypothetical protein [Kofleriaceae bacterium]